MMIRRKILWLMIMMVWVGMVTSIIVYQGGDYLAVEETVSENIEVIEESKSQGGGKVDDINYTKAKDSQNEEDFFIEYRLERDKARSEQINIFREMINNPNSDEITKKEAQKKMLALTDKMEKELEIESLIRARGYKESLAYIHEEAVDVIVHTNGLNKSDVAKIGDIIVKITGFNFEDVTIIEKKIETG
ncbi:SpoIIIAH-like family protein [Iocasia frigidifontis]|nr:SpoIIIAH-like family protein [Iocasia fonsfrigidae]